MRLSLPRPEFEEYIRVLLDSHTPDGSAFELGPAVDLALERTGHCFSEIALPNYRTSTGEPQLNHRHGDQFAMFLYFLANSAWRLGDRTLAEKAFLLNRSRHSVIIMYDTIMPDIFLLVHPMGTMIGKGNYGNRTVFYQNVTVANEGTTIPTIGDGVIFFPGSFLASRYPVGDRAVLTANTTVRYDRIPPDTIVSGASPALEFRARTTDILGRHFL